MRDAEDGRTLRDGAAGDSGSTEVMADHAPDTVRETGVGIPDIGETIAEKYVVERVIGQGGMGQVLAVRHVKLDQRFAMKVLDPELTDDEDARQRFGREARAMAQLTSPYTVRVHDVAELPNKLPYLVMDYLEGEDVGRVLRAEGAMPIEDAVRYIDQACEALEEAHAAGLVHRDLKPQNLFLAKDAKGNRSVRVLDFGIARAFGGKMGKLVTITRHGDVLGTLAYMAPEQIRSAKSVDPRTDVWAIGSCLYRVLTDARPFAAGSEGSLVEAILTKEPQPIREIRPEVPAALEFVVQKCMKKQPAARFASVTELREALRLALLTKDVPENDETVPMTHAPVRPPPVKSERPISTLPLPKITAAQIMGAMPRPADPPAPASPPQPIPPAAPSSSPSLSSPPASGPVGTFSQRPPPVASSSKGTIIVAAAIAIVILIAGVAAALHAMRG